MKYIAIVLMLFLAAAVGAYFYDEPLTNESQTWLQSAGAVKANTWDDADLQYLQQFTNQQYETPCSSSYDLACIEQISTPDAAFIGVDREAYFALLAKMPVMLNPDSSKWPAYQGFINGLHLVLHADLAKHGTIAPDTATRALALSRAWLRNSQNLLDMMIATALVGISTAASNLSMGLGADPDLFKAHLVPLPNNVTSLQTALQGELRHMHEAMEASRKAGLFTNHHQATFQRLIEHASQPDTYWREAPAQPTLNWTARLVDSVAPTATWLSYADAVRTHDYLLAVARAMARIYQGADPASHGEPGPATLTWSWYPETQTLCLGPAEPLDQTVQNARALTTDKWVCLERILTG